MWKYTHAITSLKSRACVYICTVHLYWSDHILPIHRSCFFGPDKIKNLSGQTKKTIHLLKLYLSWYGHPFCFCFVPFLLGMPAPLQWQASPDLIVATCSLSSAAAHSVMAAPVLKLSLPAAGVLSRFPTSAKHPQMR